jgi:hypothetical protein
MFTFLQYGRLEGEYYQLQHVAAETEQRVQCKQQQQRQQQ